jgi:type II secretion system (T2SS) protein N
MPASRSARRDTSPRPARRWPLILLALIVLSAAVVYLLPASMVSRFLPPQIHAEDFSGSLLHGAAGRIIVNARDAGAIEWQIHPLALLRLAAVADVHWVKVGFVIDGTAEVGTGGLTAHGIKGGGPIEDLRDLGLAAGWHGTANLTLTQIKSDFRKLEAAVGKIEVAGISSAGIADGSDLGSYVLTLAPGGIAPDGTITATVNDAGGPVEAQAQIRFSPAIRTGMLSGTLKERPAAAPALRVQLNNLAQLRPRDSYGRFPVDLEFTF